MNTKMKVLSLALIGAFGYVGAASAACPAGPAVADGGAWSTKTVSQATMAIVSPGMASSACRLAVALNQNSPLFAKSLVTDNSPANEAHYRARFYLDTTELTGYTSILRSAKIFSATSNTSPGAGISNDMVSVFLIGSASGPSVRFYVSDSGQTSNVQVVTVPLPNATGANRIEFDMPQGATAAFRYWVSTDAATTSDSTPTGSMTVNNAGWSGVKFANLGILNASNGYRTAYANTTHLYVDQFDSRRQTFIGQ